MKIAAISIVRDEGDIIEAWARHNLHFFDKIFVIDDQSSDSTPQILEALRAEGLPVELVPHAPARSYYQGRSMTRLMAHAYAEQDWDFIFPLDGDECLIAESREALEQELSGIGEGRVAGLTNIDYIMTAEDDLSDPNPLTRMHYTAPCAGTVFKVALPRKLARTADVLIADGSHSATQNGIKIPDVVLKTIALAHFPVRSREQLVAKCLCAYMRWKSRHDYNDKFAQWPIRAADFLRREKSLTVDDFSSFYASYHAGAAGELVKRPFRECRGTMRHLDLAGFYPYRSILCAVDGLIDAARVGAAVQNNELLAAERANLSPWARFLEKNFRSIARRWRKMTQKAPDV